MPPDMPPAARDSRSKVPALTLGFWIIKIAATTLGETLGDALSMTLQLGYALSSVIFLALFAASVACQVRTKHFHAFLYWAVIIATTTAGTTIADFADRSLGIGYTGGSSILFVLLMASLAIWYRVAGSISASHITSRRVEIFYWIAIMFSQTLGTALGDWAADTGGLGYEGGAAVFGAGIVIVLALYRFTAVSRTTLFWAAFILTRPLGATLGDLLDKPVAHGGLAFGRFSASAILLVFIVAGVVLSKRKKESSFSEEKEAKRLL